MKKRVFSLSPFLTDQSRLFVEVRRADGAVFLTPGTLIKTGKQLVGEVRLEPDNFVKWALRAILKESGLDGRQTPSVKEMPLSLTRCQLRWPFGKSAWTRVLKDNYGGTRIW